MYVLEEKGDYKKTEEWLKSLIKKSKNLNLDLEQLAREGLDALIENTPKRTGLTAKSWRYEIITHNNGIAEIQYSNTNIQNNGNVALILDIGHATKCGGWIEGRNYIGPSLDPIIEKMKTKVMEVIE